MIVNDCKKNCNILILIVYQMFIGRVMNVIMWFFEFEVLYDLWQVVKKKFVKNYFIVRSEINYS